MRWLGYLVLIVTELAVYDQFSQLGGPSGAAYGYFILLALLTFVAIFFHEMGHALAIWHGGGTVFSINVGFLRYNVAKRRFEPPRGLKSGEVGGYVAYAFEKRLGTPRKEIVIASAGPAANLLTGLVAMLLALAVVPSIVPAVEVVATTTPDDMQAIRSHPVGLPSDDAMKKNLERTRARESALYWSIMLNAFGVLSLGLAIANLMPFKGSDGAAILRNWRKPKPKFGMR